MIIYDVSSGDLVSYFNSSLIVVKLIVNISTFPKNKLISQVPLLILILTKSVSWFKDIFYSSASVIQNKLGIAQVGAAHGTQNIHGGNVSTKFLVFWLKILS